MLKYGITSHLNLKLLLASTKLRLISNQNSFNELLPEIKATELTKMELLGSLILADATRCCIVKKLFEYKGMNDCILLLDDHPGHFLLKNAFSPPRLLFAPCHHHPELLAEYDVTTRSTTEALFNIHIDDNSWSQAKLPVRYGGLELRTAAYLALPAFMYQLSEYQFG